MNYSPGKSIIEPHVGHRLTARDARSLRCIDCSHTLLLDINRAVVEQLDQTRPSIDEAAAALSPDAQPDGYGRMPCCRCGKRVKHLRTDGVDEPVPHTRPVTGSACSEAGAAGPAVLPAGGWRALVPGFSDEQSAAS